MPDLQTVYLKRPAMATIFELWVAGPHREHLETVGYAVLDEITRIERLFNRYDPASELSRINQYAARTPVKTDVETFTVLEDCVHWYHQTEGRFDISHNSTGSPLTEGLFLQSEGRFIGFGSEEMTLDLGGYAKGYALDKAALILSKFGVESYFIHGGTSSVLTKGMNSNRTDWKIALTNPFDNQDDTVWQRISIRNGGFSCSTSENSCCLVSGPNALIPEIMSTALIYPANTRKPLPQKLLDRYRLSVTFMDKSFKSSEIPTAI